MEPKIPQETTEYRIATQVVKEHVATNVVL